MKRVVLLATVLAVISAEWIDIDWSQVRPIEEFDHYWSHLPQELQFLRYSHPTARITNGQEAVPGQFPYQIALIIEFQSGNALCGGSVLTNNYILTAAHCMRDALGGIAIMGAHNRILDEPSQQRIAFNLNGITMHPQYTQTNTRNDIATVRLNSPITFNDRVRPIRLPNPSDNRHFAGLVGTVSGFGRTSDTSEYTSAVVRFTSNPIQSNTDCLAGWGGNTNIIQNQNICMAGDGGRSACNGDSGGPLTVLDNGSTMLVGIVSFGSSAGCTIGRPAVFVRVTYFLRWIEENSDLIATPIREI